MLPTTPNAGTHEIAARRKLEDSGYRDLRNMTPNADGTFSDVDASGNVRER